LLWVLQKRTSTFGPSASRACGRCSATLKLARDYEIQRIRVYMDSELVVDQVNGVSAVRQAHLIELHEVASSLAALFDIRISWVPRKMNAEADRLVRDALGALD
jgi:ribonuclease HI